MKYTCFSIIYVCVHWRVKLGQIHILNVPIDGNLQDGNLQDEEITHMAYF